MTLSLSTSVSSVIADQDGQEDCAILQSVVTGGHYEMTDEDRAALQTVISSLSVDDPTSPMTHDSSGRFPTLNEVYIRRALNCTQQITIPKIVPSSTQHSVMVTRRW